MDAKTSTVQHVFRQRSSVTLASVSGVTGLVLLLSLARNWGSYPRPLFGAWVVFGLALAWSILFRPAVLLDVEGVTLRNVVRDVRIPWTRLTHVTSRWNLKVLTEDRGYTAWAISSEVQRPKGPAAGMFRMPVPGRLSGVVGTAPKPSTTVPKATAQSVATVIQIAKQEYDEAVAAGGLAPAPDARVRVTWAYVAIAVLLLPALAVVALSLT